MNALRELPVVAGLAALTADQGRPLSSGFLPRALYIGKAENRCPFLSLASHNKEPATDPNRAFASLRF